MIVSAIVAMTRHRLIGSGNALPWHLPEDFKYFKDTTRGHAIIMGRKTLDSLGRKALPKRRNLVVTRDVVTQAPVADVEFFTDVQHAVDAARQGGETELFIIGGAQIYTQALPLTDRLYITWVNIDPEPAGDTHFPEFDLSQWEKVSSKPGDRCEYAVYERKKSV